MEKIQPDRKRTFWFSAMYFIMIIAMIAAGFAYGLVINQIIANTVMTGIGGGIVLFTMLQEILANGWDYDNAIRWKRYLTLYGMTLVICLMLPLLPSNGWFFPVLAVALAAYSNTVIGMVSSSVFLMMSVLLGGVSANVFALYFICNMTSIIAFRKLDDNFNVGMPVFISITILFVATAAMDILFIPGKLTVEVFVIPIINIFITAVLLLIFLKKFSSSVIHRYRERYLTINDQEFELLVELKKLDKETYYHCIHTAYLCERIAAQLNLNIPLAKALGYYHRIGILKGENSLENINAIIQEKKFPQEVADLLSQYLDKNVKLTSKEGTVLLFCDSVISTIQLILQKDRNANIDYSHIINVVFKKRIEAGKLKYSQITAQEMTKMKEILIKEQLYYDFLR